MFAKFEDIWINMIGIMHACKLLNILKITMKCVEIGDS